MLLVKSVVSLLYMLNSRCNHLKKPMNKAHELVYSYWLHIAKVIH